MGIWGPGLLDSDHALDVVLTLTRDFLSELKPRGAKRPSAGAASGIAGVALQLPTTHALLSPDLVPSDLDDLSALPPEARQTLGRIVAGGASAIADEMDAGHHPDKRYVQVLGRHGDRALVSPALFQHPDARQALESFAGRAAAFLDEGLSNKHLDLEDGSVHLAALGALLQLPPTAALKGGVERWSTPIRTLLKRDRSRPEYASNVASALELARERSEDLEPGPDPAKATARPKAAVRGRPAAPKKPTKPKKPTAPKKATPPRKPSRIKRGPQ